MMLLKNSFLRWGLGDVLYSFYGGWYLTSCRRSGKHLSLDICVSDVYS